MGLLQPDSGLLFWMSLACLVVFLILAKFGFPVIVRSLEERKRYIDESLEQAAEAEMRLRTVEQTITQRLSKAEEERTLLLRQAQEQREQLLDEARQRAAAEEQRLLREAREAAAQERQAILRDAQQQVALLAVAMTEKVLREEMQEPAGRQAVLDQAVEELKKKPIREV